MGGKGIGDFGEGGHGGLAAVKMGPGAGDHLSIGSNHKSAIARHTEFGCHFLELHRDSGPPIGLEQRGQMWIPTVQLKARSKVEGDDAIGDSLEWTPDENDDTRGNLRAYPQPWRSLVTVEYTGGGLTSISFSSVEYREETEVVEFVAGEGSVAYPVYAVGTVVWHSDSLGSVNSEVDSTELAAGTTVNDGYGLAEVTYTVRSLLYRVVGSSSIKAQFIMVDSGQ